MKIIYHPEVEKVIRSLPKEDETRVLKVVDLFVDYAFHLPPKYLKKVERNIWEFRAGRYRVLFGMVEGNAVLLNIFMKKTQKTPKREIDLAHRRMKQYEK